ncbi:MAG: hypothetical protein MJA31_06970 [Clostridia bacterium]|nr:hypothetical protein [Clostridia bacterium]
MLDFSLLNLGSIIFGLIACILPIINLMQLNQPNQKKWIIFSVTSLSSCSISLSMQIFYTKYLVSIEDWSALMDTSNAVALAAVILLIVTILLNALTLVYYRQKI